jgi:hypothetical protein
MGRGVLNSRIKIPVASKARTVIIKSEANVEHTATAPEAAARPRRIDVASHVFDWIKMVPMNAATTINPVGQNEAILMHAPLAAIVIEMNTTTIDAATAITGALCDKRFRMRKSRPMPINRITMGTTILIIKLFMSTSDFSNVLDFGII